MNKKIILAIGLATVFISGCVRMKRVGDFTIMSSKNYGGGARFYNMGRKTGLPCSEMKAAMDSCIEQVPGGEYLTNVVISYRSGFFVFDKGFVVTGDVWAVTR